VHAPELEERVEDRVALERGLGVGPRALRQPREASLEMLDGVLEVPWTTC